MFGKVKVEHLGIVAVGVVISAAALWLIDELLDHYAKAKIEARLP